MTACDESPNKAENYDTKGANDVQSDLEFHKSDFHCPACGQDLPASAKSVENVVQISRDKTKCFASGLLACPRCLAKIETPQSKARKKLSKTKPEGTPMFDVPAIRIG